MCEILAHSTRARSYRSDHTHYLRRNPVGPWTAARTSVTPRLPANTLGWQAAMIPWRFFVRSQVRESAASAASYLTWERSSVSVRWCPIWALDDRYSSGYSAPDRLRLGHLDA